MRQEAMRVQELADRIERAQSDPRQLALVLTDAINEARSDLVTEAILSREIGTLREAVEREIGTLRETLERELGRLRGDMTQEFQLVRAETAQEFKLVRAETAQGFKLVRAEMAALEQRFSAELQKGLREQARWLAAIVIAAVGLLGAILKLL